MKHATTFIYILILGLAGCRSDPLPYPSPMPTAPTTAPPIPTATIALETTNQNEPEMPSAGQEVLAFYSNRDGNPEIYIINVDGSGLRRLTDDLAFDDSPAL